MELADVKQMVLDFVDFQVIDAKSGEDLTRSILLQIILEEETGGVPMFSTQMLAQIIRFYGHAMQGMMGSYLEKNLQTFTDIQAKLAEQSKGLYDPKVNSRVASRAGPLKDIRALDDLTVQYELQQPYGPFLTALAYGWTSILPMQELEAGTFDPKKDLLGSGPFVYKEQLKGESWTFVRNPQYWRPGLPKADELAMLIIPDDTARTAALRLRLCS